MNNRTITLAALALAAAGCSRQGPTPPEGIVLEENYVEPEAPPSADPEPAPPPVTNAVEASLAEPETAPEPVDPDAQTLEDADATGLTTRAAPGSDEDAPADQ